MKELSVLLAKEKKKQERLSNIRRFFKKILSPLVKPLYLLIKYLERKEDERARKNRDMILTEKDEKRLKKAFDRFLIKAFLESKREDIFFSERWPWESTLIDKSILGDPKRDFGGKISKKYHSHLIPYFFHIYEHPDFEKFIFLPFRSMLAKYTDRPKSYFSRIPFDSEEFIPYRKAQEEWNSTSNSFKAAFPNRKTPVFIDSVEAPIIAFRIKEKKN